MAIPLEAAAAAMREAMRETVKRYSLWYLLQGILMVVAGFLALVYPLIASVAIVYLLAWILIISGIVQGIGLIGARQVPHFWLQLISVVLSIVVGLLLLRQPEARLQDLVTSGQVMLEISQESVSTPDDAGPGDACPIALRFANPARISSTSAGFVR